MSKTREPGSPDGLKVSGSKLKLTRNDQSAPHSKAVTFAQHQHIKMDEIRSMINKSAGGSKENTIFEIDQQSPVLKF